MKLKFATSICAVLVIAGCTKPVPKCNDTESVELVKQIADKEMANQLGLEASKLFSYSLGAIRTQSTDSDTGAHECAAELYIKASNTGDSNTLPITYTVELTDDGKEIYINVFGL